MPNYSLFKSRNTAVLTLILCLLILLTPGSSFGRSHDDCEKESVTESLEVLNEGSTPDDYDSLSKSDLTRWSFRLAAQNASFTGFFLMREEDNDIIGSTINEFGISAIDFIYLKKNRKIKITGIAGFLNKWYIKLLLRKDLSVAVSKLTDPSYNLPKGYGYSEEDGTITITNRKQNVSYQFSLL